MPATNTALAKSIRRKTWGQETGGNSFPPHYKEGSNWGWRNNTIMFSQGCKQISSRKTRYKITFQFSTPKLYFLDHAIFYLRENKQRKKSQHEEILTWDELWA